MSQERWDVVLWFPQGPLSLQGEITCRGPVVRMGANPGPGGLSLQGYRGLDDRQATISAYDGGTVAIAPVGSNQVRMAPHPNVDWGEIRPLKGPAYLTEGCAFHLGPPNRGVTAHFVECRRLGTWQQQNILSDAADATATDTPQIKPSEVKELRTNRGVPKWFIGGMTLVGVGISVAIVAPIIKVYTDTIDKLGPVDRGEEIYEVVDAEVILDEELLEGFNQPYVDFLQKQNAKVARRDELLRPENWDQRLLDYVTRSAQQHISGWAFWVKLEQIQEDYAYVVQALRDEGLPEVWAGIPYTESRYDSEIQSFLCAKGYWQMMPEVAHRLDVEVRDCKFRGSSKKWTPSLLAPPNGLYKNADYLRDKQCIIPPRGGCDIDQRTDLAISTRGAIKAFREAFEDVWIADSGAAVQMVIASHHAGYDDAKYLGGKEKFVNLLPAYKRHLKKKNYEFDPDFIGDSIKCETASYESISERCGSELDQVSQHYTYKPIAQHFLAVCYYGSNYHEDPRFKDYKQYTRGDGYCTRIKVPTREQVLEKM